MQVVLDLLAVVVERPDRLVVVVIVVVVIERRRRRPVGRSAAIATGALAARGCPGHRASRSSSSRSSASTSEIAVPIDARRRRRPGRRRSRSTARHRSGTRPRSPGTAWWSSSTHPCTADVADPPVDPVRGGPDHRPVGPCPEGGAVCSFSDRAILTQSAGSTPLRGRGQGSCGNRPKDEDADNRASPIASRGRRR